MLPVINTKFPVHAGSAEDAKVPVAVVENEIWVADFRQVATLCVINLTNLDVTDVFRTKSR